MKYAFLVKQLSKHQYSVLIRMTAGLDASTDAKIKLLNLSFGNMEWVENVGVT